MPWKQYFGPFLGVMVWMGAVPWSAKADTVQARCDVYPKGSDQVSFSGLCFFSQRQGVVGIQLPNGQRYDLLPAGDRPNTYTDLAGQPATRTLLEGRGHLYCLAQQSIYVFWDPAPYQPQEF